MHEIWTIVMQPCCANMADRIGVLLAVETLGDPRNIVLDWSPNFPYGFYVAFITLL